MRSAGFVAGLIVDVATLGTLGLTSLLLTLAGYWAGRYGETTGRSRAHAPLVGDRRRDHLRRARRLRPRLAARRARGRACGARSRCRPAVIWNALLAYPVFALVRRLVGTTERVERAREVELLV